MCTVHMCTRILWLLGVIWDESCVQGLFSCQGLLFRMSNSENPSTHVYGEDLLYTCVHGGLPLGGAVGDESCVPCVLYTCVYGGLPLGGAVWDESCVHMCTRRTLCTHVYTEDPSAARGRQQSEFLRWRTITTFVQLVLAKSIFKLMNKVAYFINK